jgi:hypothetical protein
VIGENAGTTITRLKHFKKRFFEGQTKRNSLGETITILESWLQEIDQQIRENVVSGVHWVRPNLLPPIPGDDTPQEYGAVDKDGKGDRKREFVLVDRMKDPRGPMAWKSEWKKLQTAGVDGPRVDYRRRDKYIYPEIILEPPKIGYPKLQRMKELMHNWPQDEDDTGTITETLLRFNFSNPVEREAARKFRDVELPFKIHDIPEIDYVTKLWTDDYVSVISMIPIGISTSLSPLPCLRGCYRQFGVRGVMTDVMIAGSAGVGWSRGGLVTFLFRSLSLSKVGSARYDAVWVRGVDRCGRGSERCFVG